MKIVKVKPLFTTVVVTADKYTNEISDDIVSAAEEEGNVKEFQRVIAVGDSVKNIKVGDLVCFNPERYAVRMHKDGSLKDGIITDNPVMYYNFKTIVLDNEECLVLQNTDIEFIIEDYED